MNQKQNIFTQTGANSQQIQNQNNYYLLDNNLEYQLIYQYLRDLNDLKTTNYQPDHFFNHLSSNGLNYFNNGYKNIYDFLLKKYENNYLKNNTLSLLDYYNRESIRFCDKYIEHIEKKFITMEDFAKLFSIECEFEYSATGEDIIKQILSFGTFDNLNYWLSILKRYFSIIFKVHYNLEEYLYLMSEEIERQRDYLEEYHHEKIEALSFFRNIALCFYQNINNFNKELQKNIKIKINNDMKELFLNPLYYR